MARPGTEEKLATVAVDVVDDDGDVGVDDDDEIAAADYDDGLEQRVVGRCSGVVEDADVVDLVVVVAC